MYKLGKHRGDALVSSLIAAMISAVVGLGISYSIGAGFQGQAKIEKSIHASTFGDIRISILKHTRYSELVGHGKTEIANTSNPKYYDEVILGDEVANGPANSQGRWATIKIYEEGVEDAIGTYRYFCLKRPALLYYELGENEDGPMTQKAVTDAVKPLTGFEYLNNPWGKGRNPYVENDNLITNWYHNGAEISFYENAAKKQVDVVLDGFFYQNEGNYRVVDTHDLELLKNDIKGEIYPVGSIYTTTNGTNPATTLGFGTWQSIGSGRVLMGVDSNHVAGTTVESGLPNIEACWDCRNSDEPLTDSDGDGDVMSGAFYHKWASKCWSLAGWSTADCNGGWQDISFDASKSNPIYGNSNIVQPPAYFVYFWRRIA